MFTVNVRQATNDLRRSFDNLSAKQIAKATSIALNKTLLKGRTVARTAVKKVYNIPQKNLSGVAVIRSQPGYLKGAITASTRPIPMDAFSPKFEFSSAGGSSSVISISRRGLTKVREIKKARNEVGVSVEIKKGNRVVIPYAFLLSNAKPRVFARGEYKSGNGSYGFMQRHTRQENASGNDSVKPLASVTIFGAVVNPLVKQDISRVMQNDYPRNLLTALRYQASKM